MRALFACGAADLAARGPVAGGSGGCGVEGLEVIEGGVFVVDIQDYRASTQDSGGVAVEGGAVVADLLTSSGAARFGC